MPLDSKSFDVVVVGAGFAGLYALERLRKLGFRVIVLEQGGDVGGTWNWNRYPGARCDVESLEYSYGFCEQLEQEWHWSERYAAQPEILAYANHVADRFDLRRDIVFHTTVERLSFDEQGGLWTVETDTRDDYRARFCVMAIGCLSVPRRPDFEGLDRFQGDWYHTGFWPHEPVDFSGQRVGIIGTGSSAIQAIPIIAAEARHLTVFQRTANFSIPAHNAPLDAGTEQYWKEHYRELRREARETSSGILNIDSDCNAFDLTAEERRAEIERRWLKGGLGVWNTFGDMLTDEKSNAVVADFVRDRIREIVKDPEVAERLCPKGYPIGSKRLCVDSGYYATFNRDNVTLVDVRNTPIEAITPEGLRTTEKVFEFDALVFATGFDAMTGPLLRIETRGRRGIRLQDKWAAGPRSCLGLMIADFPNLFTVTGPGSPSVLSNMMVAIEQHIDWIADCLVYLREHEISSIEPTEQAESDWVAHCNAVADQTLYPRADSWYMGANIPGKPRVFMPYVGGASNYRHKCNEVAANDYEGFLLR